MDSSCRSQELRMGSNRRSQEHRRMPIPGAASRASALPALPSHPILAGSYTHSVPCLCLHGPYGVLGQLCPQGWV